MKYCTRCLYPENHPYGIIFDSDGVCSGCRVHEEKDTINWDLKFQKLKNIALSNKERVKGRGFDCIIPVTGGGDSYFIVHTVKNVLGMNPLLVHYNHQFNTKAGIRNLANLSTVFDCEILTTTLSPDLLKRITRASLKKYGSIYWQALAGYYTYPVQMAVKFRVPLIIWGVQPWSEQTGMFSHHDEAEMTERCRKEHGLMGLSAEDFIDPEHGISRSDVQPFIYPYDNEIEAVGLRGLYLSNYIRWDSKKQHEKMIELYGYESKEQYRTFNKYEDVHCHLSASLHDYIKFTKLGYSKVTDHASREIRLKRMTRNEGIKMVEKYSQLEPDEDNLKTFLNWADISKKDFYECINKHRDPKIWNFNSKDNKWKINCSISHLSENKHSEVQLERKEDCNFLTTPVSEDIEDIEYLLMGRSYFDKYHYGSIQDSPKDGNLTPRKWQKPKIG